VCDSVVFGAQLERHLACNPVVFRSSPPAAFLLRARGGGRWVADKGEREGKEASPGACSTWVSAGLGVGLGVDLPGRRGGGVFVFVFGGAGLWWGLW
jgi:hypothetical protein